MLTDDQIQYLDQRCQMEGIRYYDLRIEIADHLATEVEAIMENNARIDFPALVDTVFERFEKNFLNMLTNEQIKTLDLFCQKKGIHYYDLRQEMVDHLAEGIEGQMTLDPQTGFDTALQRVYSAFGISGFSNVIRQREEATRKRSRKREHQYFKAWFTFPKIALSLLLFLLLSAPVSVFNVQNAAAIYKTYCIFLFAFAIFAIIFVGIRFKRPAQKLLSLKHTGGFTVFVGLFQVPNLYFNLAVNGFELDINHTPWFNLAMAAFCTLAILFTLARYHAYKAIYADARRQYPLVF
ncbi:hypothetical protein [Niabella drilacis]|uniref:Uncharacterized protein n=1 Tax=Niabella drilacis (strain DSM 25811 / CCM 8410 / CCUG 62505 / LMG 26954 / E90) TaxID=1285928 RepID=A0A1G7B169_NIADE|nr:hypothetical protein [Niabella drilacis]SDE20692.1 hypothetical protein SAMN04487894_12637 [Niabella drilacis]